MRDWDWLHQDGKPDVGQPTTFTTETDDGYEISVTLQENEDGVLVCSGLDIQFKNKNLAPDRPINSRYFQLLGLGEILQSARNKYLELADIINESYLDTDSLRETKNWPYPGATGHTDEKYAYLAYMYVRFIGLAKPNPIDELAQHMNCDRETAASRIAEVRKRGLLTRPRQGVLGGRLTSKAEKLLGIKKVKK